MTPVQWLLLGIAAMFLLGSLGEMLFRRTGIPDVIWLVAAGIGLGPLGGVVSREDLTRLAPPFAAITLVVILFQGGTTIKWRDVAHSAPRSGVIAVLGFVLAATAVTGLTALAIAAGVAPAGWTWLHGALLGAICGGSSSIIIMPAMAQARVREDLSELLKIESALTDILCVVFTAALIDVLLGRSKGGASAVVDVVRSFGIAIAIGATAGLLWVVLLRLVKVEDHAYPVTLAALLALYVLIEHAGGNPALGIFTVAVVLGNSSEIEQRLGVRQPHELDAGVRGVHLQVTFIIKTFFFVFLGAMLGPPWSLVGVGAALALVLLATRLPAVWLGTARSSLTRGERQIAAVALPRGLAAGVLATLPAAAGVPHTAQLPVLVFSAVIASVLLFAIGFPILRRRLPAEAAAPAAAARQRAAAEVAPAAAAEVAPTAAAEVAPVASAAAEVAPAAPAPPAIGAEPAAPEPPATGTDQAEPTPR